MANSINKKTCLAMLMLIAISALAFFYKSQLMSLFRAVLESPITTYIVWAFTCIVLLSNYLFVARNADSNPNLIITQFGRFADFFFNIFTYGFIATTALNLVKGIYIQQFFKDTIYFNEFTGIDIWSMFGVCLFMFGYVTHKLYIISLETVFYTNATEVVPAKE